MMNFDDQSIGSDGDGGAGEWRHLVALAGAVAWINHDGQVAETLDGRHNAEIERVASVIREGAHSALAQDYVVASLAHDVLGGHEKFFERRRDAALQEDRLAGASGELEQREILHVAGASLDDIGVLVDQVERFVIDGFGDDEQSEAFADFGHDLQTFFAQSLKRIRRSARLIGSAAEELGSGAGDALGDFKRLIASLDSARAGDDGQVGASDGDRRTFQVRICKFDDGVVGLGVATDQFVGFGDADDFLHAGHFFQCPGFDLALIASDADGGALRARHGVGAVSERFDLLANGADLLFGGLRLHDYQHMEYSELLS